MSPKPKFIPSPERIEKLTTLYKKMYLARKKRSKPQIPKNFRYSDIPVVKCKDLGLDPHYMKENF